MPKCRHDRDKKRQGNVKPSLQNGALVKTKRRRQADRECKVPTQIKELRVVEQVRRAKVAEVFLAVIGEEGAGEGVAYITGPNRERLPLVALDRRGLSILRQYSQEVANRRGETVSIICFTSRRLHDRVRPLATGD